MQEEQVELQDLTAKADGETEETAKCSSVDESGSESESGEEHPPEPEPAFFPGLRRVLEEFEKGNDVHISDVINFINELYRKDQDDEMLTVQNDDEIRKSIIQHAKLEEGNEYLNLNQCMKYLGTELQIDKEEDVLKAFNVFDKKNTGTISLTELKRIMEEQGEPLTEEELRSMEEYTRMFEAEEPPAPEEKEVEEDPSVAMVEDTTEEGKKKKKKRRLRRKKKDKKKKDKLDEEEDEEYDPDDIKVDYKAFVKGIMQTILHQEGKLWGGKKTE